MSPSKPRIVLEPQNKPKISSPLVYESSDSASKLRFKDGMSGVVGQGGTAERKFSYSIQSCPRNLVNKEESSKFAFSCVEKIPKDLHIFGCDVYKMCFEKEINILNHPNIIKFIQLHPTPLLE